MKSKVEHRKKRHQRVRKKVFGTKERPRLCVFKSLKHIYAQLVNDEEGVTIVTASTISPEIREAAKKAKKTEAAKMVGQLIAQLAKTRGIEQVVFDRGGYLYHGRVKSLAEGARTGGLQF